MRDGRLGVPIIDTMLIISSEEGTDDTLGLLGEREVEEVEKGENILLTASSMRCSDRVR